MRAPADESESTVQIKEERRAMQLFVNLGQGCLSILLISASLHDMFVLYEPASACDVRRNETPVFVIGIQETYERSPGPPMRAICISKPFPFTVIIPSKAIVK